MEEAKNLSVEGQLDRSIEELIAKLVNQVLTDAEETKLRQLVAHRSRKMRRDPPQQIRKFSRVRLTA